jgi:hypothetical protein
VTTTGTKTEKEIETETETEIATDHQMMQETEIATMGETEMMITEETGIMPMGRTETDSRIGMSTEIGVARAVSLRVFPGNPAIETILRILASETVSPTACLDRLGQFVVKRRRRFQFQLSLPQFNAGHLPLLPRVAQFFAFASGLMLVTRITTTTAPSLLILISQHGALPGLLTSLSGA